MRERDGDRPGELLLEEMAREEVPPRLRLREGKVEAAVGGGEVEAAVGSGKVEAAVGGGEVEAAVGRGKVEAAVGSGKVEAAVGSGKVEAAVGSGKVEAAVSGGKVEAAVGGGEVEATVCGGEVEAAIGGGEVEAAVGGGEVEAAVGGRGRSDFGDHALERGLDLSRVSAPGGARELGRETGVPALECIDDVRPCIGHRAQLAGTLCVELRRKMVARLGYQARHGARSEHDALEDLPVRILAGVDCRSLAAAREENRAAERGDPEPFLAVHVFPLELQACSSSMRHTTTYLQQVLFDPRRSSGDPWWVRRDSV
ncbi:MAG TPA: hypothetical protein VMH40_18640 [Myxococcaceae bacterium]|nr:hypothetical protein [Myxococcaceae bacterium]